MKKKGFLNFTKKEKEFLAKFAVLFTIPYVLMKMLDLSILTQWIAQIESSLLQATGTPATTYGSIISTPTIEYEIIPDCTGLVMVAMLFALLYTTPVKKRGFFLLAGTPLLLSFNLARLYLTFITGLAFDTSVLDAMHVLLWFIDAGLVLAIWAKASDLW